MGKKTSNKHFAHYVGVHPHNNTKGRYFLNAGYMYLLENVFLLDRMFNLMTERCANVKIMKCTYFCSLCIMKQILTYFRTFLHEDMVNNFGYTCSSLKTFLSIQ